MHAEIIFLCKPVLWLIYLKEQDCTQAEPSLKEAVCSILLVSRRFQMTLHFIYLFIYTLLAALANPHWAAGMGKNWARVAQCNPAVWGPDGLSAACWCKAFLQAGKGGITLMYLLQGNHSRFFLAQGIGL